LRGRCTSVMRRPVYFFIGQAHRNALELVAIRVSGGSFRRKI